MIVTGNRLPLKSREKFIVHQSCAQWSKGKRIGTGRVGSNSTWNSFLLFCRNGKHLSLFQIVIKIAQREVSDASLTCIQQMTQVNCITININRVCTAVD